MGSELLAEVAAHIGRQIFAGEGLGQGGYSSGLQCLDPLAEAGHEDDEQ